MRILILGGDGYLGWPTAMYLSKKKHDVCVLDNFSKRQIEIENNIQPLDSISTLHDRVEHWNTINKKKISLRIGDILNAKFLYTVLSEIKPDTIVHYAEQPSAPYSMMSREKAVMTQYNNVIGNLNLLFAMKSIVPNCHLVKLGTMGEYGTPNIDIEEGYLKIKHNGREDIVSFPKKPGSFYHLSKVHDSHNIMFACKIWNLRATDLNQGVVYGVQTEETAVDKRLRTSFHYDEIFGTLLNRLCTQVVCKHPLTVYGNGSQKRGYLNITDTLKCVELSCLNPAEKGEFRVFNQFTETFSVLELASKVEKVGNKIGYKPEIKLLKNPRIEQENHYYNPKHKKLTDMGLKPTLLNDEFIASMINEIEKSKSHIKKNIIKPKVKWNQ